MLHRPVESDPPGITDEQLHTLLTAPSVEVDFGADLLDMDLSFVEDISEDLVDGTVERNNDATVHGTCDLQLTRALAWGVDLVRPWMAVTDGVRWARWNEGVYCLTTPDIAIGETPTTYDAVGHDRLHLLQDEVGMDYTVTAGTTYRQALDDAFTAAGVTGVRIDGSAADDTLPKDKPWPLVPTDTSDPDQTDTPVTWLRVINGLLDAINFRGVWVDQNGFYRCSAYQEPTARAPEFTLDADNVDETIVGEDRTVRQDVWKTPNRWVFRWSNRPGGEQAVEGDGMYVVDRSDTTNGDWLGRKRVKSRTFRYEAASQAKLVDLGDRRVAGDLRVTKTFEIDTGPFPGAGHWDIFTLIDGDAGGTYKVQATDWTMPLNGDDMTWRLEVIT